ncbi:hypothetical protein F4679DRAFT_132937 [Xylaria curta]|nr:hypothetical protein F4679DRAFT_132937 [Xylaria curta]
MARIREHRNPDITSLRLCLHTFRADPEVWHLLWSASSNRTARRQDANDLTDRLVRPKLIGAMLINTSQQSGQKRTAEVGSCDVTTNVLPSTEAHSGFELGLSGRECLIGTPAEISTTHNCGLGQKASPCWTRRPENVVTGSHMWIVVPFAGNRRRRATNMGWKTHLACTSDAILVLDAPASRLRSRETARQLLCLAPGVWVTSSRGIAFAFSQFPRPTVIGYPLKRNYLSFDVVRSSSTSR